MGLFIDREDFDERCYALFAERLQKGLRALRSLLDRPGFGRGASSIGAELELVLIDDEAQPSGINRDILAEVLDARFALELDRFNLEFNASPVFLAGHPFTLLARELRDGLRVLNEAASHHGAHAIAIGILPTLHLEHLQSAAMTDAPRFRALSRAIRSIRGGPFGVYIDGDPPLHAECDDVTLEGANTSFQVHLRVDPDAFSRTYNAAQLATAPVLAASGNAPFFAGRRLWEETRIALFKQSVDARRPSPGPHPPARVTFGRRWVEHGAYELFADSVALHAPLLPVVGDEDAEAIVAEGGVPSLDELRLHHGTVWTWNRAVYAPDLGGHLRIELRALPAGPTVIDMMANAAFLLGSTLALARQADELTGALPFEEAEHNFYRAAQHGLSATLRWPAGDGHPPHEVGARTLVERLLPRAHEGLITAGVGEDEASSLLSIVKERVASGQTGAAWQRAEYEAAPRRGDAAFAAMVVRYRELSVRGDPVHTWRVSTPRGR